MKITINTDPDAPDTQVTITCKRLTPEIEKILSLLRMCDMQLTGKRGGEIFLMDVAKVLYIDTADKKTFFYTEEGVYETNLRLGELEEQLLPAGFFRAGKSCVINFRHIISLKADIDRRIRVTMSNGEQLIVSRQYADTLKHKLGVK